MHPLLSLSFLHGVGIRNFYYSCHPSYQSITTSTCHEFLLVGKGKKRERKKIRARGGFCWAPPSAARVDGRGTRRRPGAARRGRLAARPRQAARGRANKSTRTGGGIRCPPSPPPPTPPRAAAGRRGGSQVREARAPVRSSPPSRGSDSDRDRGPGGVAAAAIRKFAAAHGIPGAERRLFYAANDAVSYDRKSNSADARPEPCWRATDERSTCRTLPPTRTATAQVRT